MEQDENYYSAVPRIEGSGTLLAHQNWEAGERRLKDEMECGTLSEWGKTRVKQKLLGAALLQGKREYSRMYKKLECEEPDLTGMEWMSGPLDKLTDEEYARYVEMTKAAERDERGGRSGLPLRNAKARLPFPNGGTRASADSMQNTRKEKKCRPEVHGRPSR